MKLRSMAALLLLMLCAGCTTFHVVQTDESTNERIIKTDLKATAWFSSAQAISKIKALQTDKTQSFGSEAIGQQGSTNMIRTLEAVVRILELTRPTP